MIADQEAGSEIEYSGYSKQVEIKVVCGYDPQSTRKDLSKRDPVRYLTTSQEMQIITALRMRVIIPCLH